jgi:hypothetical protein
MSKKQIKKVSEVSGARQIHTVSDVLSDNIMPEGTNYMFFEENEDLEEGVEVVAKTYSGKRRGVITAIGDNGVLEINDSPCFISDVLYTIVC